MKYQFQFLAFFLSILTGFLVGCSEIIPCDNQINLSPSIKAVVNPIPVQRNFLHNNKSHKILVAIVDTGIDYNHPDLVDSIHFDLNGNNKPTRLGWDYIGQDGWPAPYIGRRTANSDSELNLIDKLIEEDKQLGIYLDKRRNVVQEYLASVWHGTSMAECIVRREKKIGLLAYRVVPPNVCQNAPKDYSVQIIENLTNACLMAIDDGSNIIVMTTFLHFEKKDNLHHFTKISAFKDKLEKLIQNNPNVLFITSAGNGHGYEYSGRSLAQIDFPAGIVAENLVVVGSLANDGKISTFSNIPVGKINAAFFPGQNRHCVYPQNMLGISEKYLMMLPSLLDNLYEGNESYESVASYLRFFEKNKMIVNDGTSFSTALAANACAKLWIENKKLSPNEIINQLMKNSYKISQVSF
jgi:hypothetical protein